MLKEAFTLPVSYLTSKIRHFYIWALGKNTEHVLTWYGTIYWSIYFIIGVFCLLCRQAILLTLSWKGQLYDRSSKHQTAGHIIPDNQTVGHLSPDSQTVGHVTSDSQTVGHITPDSVSHHSRQPDSGSHHSRQPGRGSRHVNICGKFNELCQSFIHVHIGNKKVPPT